MEPEEIIEEIRCRICDKEMPTDVDNSKVRYIDKHAKELFITPIAIYTKDYLVENGFVWSSKKIARYKDCAKFSVSLDGKEYHITMYSQVRQVDIDFRRTAYLRVEDDNGSYFKTVCYIFLGEAIHRQAYHYGIMIIQLVDEFKKLYLAKEKLGEKDV